MQMYLASHSRVANRVLGLLGTRRIERIGQRAALRSVRKAYATVPYYRTLLTSQGMTDEKIKRLSWEEFQQLPVSNKKRLAGVADKDLLDKTIVLGQGDAAIGRSSGTTNAPVFWPLGWSEFYIGRASLQNIFTYLGTPEGTPTAAVLLMAIEGGDLSGNTPYRTFFSLKEEYNWNMEVIATGEDAKTAHTWFRWLADQGFTSLAVASFPGTFERFLAYDAALPKEEQIPWEKFTKKHIVLGGQLVARQIRDRYYQQMQIDPTSLFSETVIYVSSDTGQLTGRSTPFTLWLERLAASTPGLLVSLGLEEEHETKPILEFLPPMSMQLEWDHPEGLLITQWKHRPLIRYAIGDLAWSLPSQKLQTALTKLVPNWRKLFYAAGGHPLDIPKVTRVGIILGRSDDVCIVNGANVSVGTIWQALTDAGIADKINHFKHGSDPARPNIYGLTLELKETATPEECQELTNQWSDKVFQSLIAVPGSMDLAAAHRTNPVTFYFNVRSRTDAEFVPSLRGKTNYLLKNIPE